jgi:hypothetical protein
MSADPYADLQTFMADRGGREYRTADNRGHPVRVFYDADTLCVEMAGATAPVLALDEGARRELSEITGAAWAVSKITGIALGNSALETPGFPGARLIGQAGGFPAHLDPSVNPFLGGGAGAEKLPKHLDPAQNPFIKVD